MIVRAGEYGQFPDRPQKSLELSGVGRLSKSVCLSVRRLKRSVVQFNPSVILAFLFNESLLPSAVNHTFLYFYPCDK